MRRWQQTLSVAALAGEILETLPETHGSYGVIAQAEADAHLALGLIDRSLARWQRLLERFQRLAAAEPDRADYQHDIVVSLVKLSETGAGPDATEALPRALTIVENLAASGRLVDRIRQTEPCFPGSARGLPVFQSDSGRTLLNDFPAESHPAFSRRVRVLARYRACTHAP